MPDSPTCPACGETGMQVFLELAQVPVHQNLLYPTETAAQHAVRGDIRLAFCPTCGFIANCAFNPGLMNYSEFYDNTQCFSTLFNQYVDNLATALIDRYQLHDKQIIEIGCGKGHFIKLLCQLGPNRGVGFDPSYVGDEFDGSGRVRFIKDFYTEAYAQYSADLYCSRHVIEHVPQPSEMLASVRRAVQGRRDSAIFFETPDVTWILRNLTFWDIFYEHCSLFSPGSLARMYARHGFDTTHIQSVFGGQYQWAEGRLSSNALGSVLVEVDDVDTMFAHIDYFTNNYRHKVNETQNLMEGISHAGKRAVIWGAGAKAVTLLNWLGIRPNLIPFVVDINPRKKDMFIAGTGQQIVTPDYLKSFTPDTILVMNPNYTDEIRKTCQEIGVSAEILTI